MSGPAWQALTGLPAWEITQIPRDDEPRPQSPASDRADRGAARRVQALAAACRRGAPVAFGWIRDRAGGRVRVIAAGPGLMAAADADEMVLTLPAAARARPLPPGGGASLFTALGCWIPVGIIADALLADPGQDREPGAGRTAGRLPPSPEEALLGSWPLPFGWIVIAEPVAGGQLRDMVSQVALAQLAAQRHDSPRAQLEARRGGAGTPSCGGPPRPGCGTSGCWPAVSHRMPPRRSPGCCARRRTWRDCRTRWHPRPAAARSRRSSAAPGRPGRSPGPAGTVTACCTT